MKMCLHHGQTVFFDFPLENTFLIFKPNLFTVFFFSSHF